MALLRPLVLNDLFKMHHCNLDNFTQTFDVSYYLDYLAKWPHLCKAIDNQSGQVEGYSKCPLAR
jgi:N-terminal acetyltransferase B complex catalytic subunit